MATVYSLICFGGRTGKTVTLSIASPCVASLTNHGLRDGAGVVFSSSGALPTGIASGVTYYAKSTGDGTFNLYDTSANAIAGGATGRINTSGSQSGTHTVKSQKMLDLFSAYPNRWGSSGSERAYDGAQSWITARSSASPYDDEIGEVGESFTDPLTAQLVIKTPAARTVLTSMLAGSRSDGWHKGNFPSTLTLSSGYALLGIVGVGSMVNITGYRSKTEGILILSQSWDNWESYVKLSAPLSSCENCFVFGIYASGAGIRLNNTLTSALNNVVSGASYGIFLPEWTYGITTIGNLTTGCVTGIGSAQTPMGFHYNNISVGNGTNWSIPSTAQIEAASNNAGLSGEALAVGTGTRITIATTDFADFSAKNFRPANGSSPQVDSGVSPYGALYEDISGRVRPDYMNGATAYFDVGPYEYDHGYGPWPASATISLTSIVSGSRVLITKASDGAVLYNDVPGTSLSFNTTHIGDFNVVVRKATASPFYREFNASGTTVADQTTSIKCLQQLDE